MQIFLIQLVLCSLGSGISKVFDSSKIADKNQKEINFMLSFKKALSVCALLIIIISLNAKEINVPKTLQAPVIDGKSSDKCWDTVAWNSGFNLIGDKDSKAPVKTKFKFLHDNNNLYLIVVADEPFTNKIKAKIKVRDRNVFFDDSIELFLNANNDNTTYHQFIFNTRGTIYDSEHTQGGVLNYAQWNCEAKTKSHVGKDKWTLEAVIPIVALNVNSKKWRFNIGRNRTTESKWRSYTFSGRFDHPSTFATLNFIDADFSKYNINIKSLYDKKTIIRNGKAYFTAKTFIQNNTDKTLFVKIDTGLSKGGKYQVKKGIGSGDNQEVIINIPVKKEGIQQAYIKVYDYRNNALLGFLDREVKIKVIGLEIKLTKPVYRNNIYATQKLSKIAGNIITPLDKKALSHTSLMITLNNRKNKVIGSVKIKKVKENNKFSIPVKNLKLGRYVLDAKLLKNNKVLYSNSTVINKLPKVADEFRIDKHGNVLHNGKFFMPYGWFSLSAKYFEEEKKHGTNIFLSYVAYYYSDKKIKKWFDLAHKHGLKIIIYAYSARSQLNKEEWRKPLSNKDALAIRKWVNKWKNHPAIAAWYLGDEPFIRLALPARMEAIYKIVSSADPYHPTIILEDVVDGIYKYADYCDILMADPYPTFAKGGYAIRGMEHISRFSEAIDEHKGKGHWMTPQAFNYQDFGASNNRAPNFVELRCQQYKLFVGGSTGTIWWVHYNAQKYPACEYGVRYLAKEVGLLKAVVEQNWRRKILKTSSKSLNAAWYKNINGHDYIIAVNMQVAGINAKITLPVNKTWYVMSENRKVQSNGKFLQDKFGMYEVHIYTTNKDVANKLSIAKIKQQIKDKEMKK